MQLGTTRRNRTLKNKMDKRGLTTDCSHYVDKEAQAFIGMLRDITTFAKSYGVTERGVLRHIYAGDIPCVFISGIAFVLDLGPEIFARELGWELGPEHLDIIEKLIVEKLATKRAPSPKHLRAKKSGHDKVDIVKEWKNSPELRNSDYFKIGSQG